MMRTEAFKSSFKLQHIEILASCEMLCAAVPTLAAVGGELQLLLIRHGRVPQLNHHPLLDVLVELGATLPLLNSGPPPAPPSRSAERRDLVADGKVDGGPHVGIERAVQQQARRVRSLPRCQRRAQPDCSQDCARSLIAHPGEGIRWKRLL
eukprot:9124270-Pyramimonas_sp.AAC.1